VAAHTENLDRLAAFTREASTRRAYKDRPKPEQHRMYAALIGGPLGGLLLDITGWQPEEIYDGAALPELGRWPGGRALYDSRPGVTFRFYSFGDTP